MSSQEQEIIITESKLQEIYDKLAPHIVGCCLKRVDLFYYDTAILKKSIKESIYEGLRSFKDTLILGRTGIVFKSKGG